MSNASDLPATEGLEDRPLRAKAVRRSWVCPGAGFALLGRDELAISTYLTSLATFGAAAVLIIEPGALVLWAAVGLLGVATTLWVAEQLAVKRLHPRTPKPRFLVAGFFVATAAGWLAAALVLVLLFSRFGSLQLAGSGMFPTLDIGERVLYEKRVQPERLQRGAIIVYRLSDRSAWGEPGWLMISRILAVPGDQLSIRGGGYLVNGEAGPTVAVTGRYRPVIAIPSAPETLTLPDNHFFVVQDSPTSGFDSRVLSWVETKEIVSTRLYYLSGRRLLQAVE